MLGYINHQLVELTYDEFVHYNEKKRATMPQENTEASRLTAAEYRTIYDDLSSALIMATRRVILVEDLDTEELLKTPGSVVTGWLYTPLIKDIVDSPNTFLLNCLSVLPYNRSVVMSAVSIPPNHGFVNTLHRKSKIICFDLSE